MTSLRVRLRAVGGSFAAAIVLAAVIALVGLLPMLLPGNVTTSFRFEVGSPAGGAIPPAAKAAIAKLGSRCHWTINPPEVRHGTLICEASENEAFGLPEIESAIESSGLTLLQPTTMTNWIIALPWATAATMFAYVLMAALLVRRTEAGWGWTAMRRLHWRLPLLVILPTAVAFALGFLAGLSVDGRVSPPQSASLPLAAWGFFLLPVFAALPEEALLRGWLHERLFSNLPPWVAYLLVAEVFVLMHFTFLGAALLGDSGVALATFHVAVLLCLSLAFTWIRRVGGSLTLCVIAHAIYNAAVIAMSLTAPAGG